MAAAPILPIVQTPEQVKKSARRSLCYTLGVWQSLWIRVLPDKSINTQLVSKYYVLRLTRWSSADNTSSPLDRVMFRLINYVTHSYIKISLPSPCFLMELTTIFHT